MSDPNGAGARVIAVVGEGEAGTVADRCALTVALKVVRDGAAEALAELSALSDRVVAAVIGAEVPRADIATQNVTVQDWYEPQGQRIAGQAATYVLTIGGRTLPEVGPLLETMSTVAGDALQIQGIALSASDAADAEARARAAAVVDGQARAQQLASAAGVALGELVSIEEGAVAIPRPMAGVVRMAASSAAMPIEPGSTAVRVRVTLTYAIGDGA